jgi:plastocyanin
VRVRHPYLPVLALAALVLTSCNSSSDNTGNPGPGVELSSGTLNNGDTFQHKFNAAGSFPYKCTIHGSCTGLFGTVVVVGASTPIQAANHTLAVSQGDGGGCFTLSSSLDSVHVGETVTWTNHSQVPHNVITR